MTFLRVSHQIQQEQADCLVACAAMVLTYHSISFRHPHLPRLLKTQKQGTVFGNLAFLEKIDVHTEVGKSNDYDNITLLTSTLENSNPLIVGVLTSELQTYWKERAYHAVVVVGMDEQNVLLNDPAFKHSPQIVPIDEFLIAWGEHDYLYAILTSPKNNS